MNAERWRQVRQLFQDCRRRPIEEWSRYLASVCDDPGLRAEVEALLHHADRPDELLDRQALRSVDSPSRSTRESPIGPGDRVDGFTIERLLDRGGMGQVFEATQEEPHRRVALKLMSVGLDVSSSHRRFRREVALLGRLNHPGIAQVYAAGVYDLYDADGTMHSVPYCAMELVEGGESITGYARSHECSVDERLNLFARVCDAVHHGHQHAVLHRDLKPANLLVTPEGEPKVIDFGVARALDAADEDGHGVRTSFGQIAGTLRYMSPEQFELDPTILDIRTDVYSLGVVLYELLCGRLPFDLPSNLHRAGRIVKERAPLRPSAVDPSLSGDLEAIVLRALERDRELRYSTVHDLGTDLRRFLRGEPVSARVPTAVENLRRFVRAHRLVAGLTLLSVAALLAAVIGTSVGYVRATHAERDARTKEASAERNRLRAEAKELEAVAALDDARRQTQNVEALLGFYKAIFIGEHPFAQGPRTRLADILDEVGATVDDRFEGRPELELEIRQLLGTAYERLALDESAEPQFRRALELCQEMSGPSDPSTLGTKLLLAGSVRALGRTEETSQILSELLATQRESGDTTVLAPTLLALGELALSEGRIESAESFLLESVELAEVDVDTQIPYGHALRCLGTLRRLQGRLDEAEQLVRRALSIYEDELGEEHFVVASALGSLVPILEAQGLLDEAESTARRAVESCRRLCGPEHASTLTNRRIFANLLMKRGKLEEAGRIFEQQYDVASRVFGSDDTRTLNAALGLGTLAVMRGNLDDAEPLLRACVSGFGEAYGEQSAWTLDAVQRLAYTLAQAGRDGDLIDLVRLHLASDADDERVSSFVLSLRILLANSLAKLEQFADAESEYREAERMLRRLHGDRHPKLEALSTTLTDLCNRWRDADPAGYANRAAGSAARSEESEISGQEGGDRSN